VHLCFSIYDALSATPCKVVKLLEDVEPQNANQTRVLSYLTQFIGNMKPDELRAFFRFTMGSSVCSGRKINIQQNVPQTICTTVGAEVHGN